MQTSLTLSGTIALPDGSVITEAPPVLINPVAVGQVLEVVLGTTPFTLVLPTGAIGVSIQPPANNTTPITLKGVTGDTGFRIHPTAGVPALCLDPSVPALVLVAASNMSSPTVFKIF